MNDNLTLADFDERVGIYRGKVQDEVLSLLSRSQIFNNLTVKEVRDTADKMYDELTALQESRSK